MKLSILSAALLTLTATTAHADDTADARRVALAPAQTIAIEDATQPAPAPPRNATGIERAIERDAAAGRAYLSPTALTSPQLSVTTHSIGMLPIIGGGVIAVSPHDRLELGIGGAGVIPLFEGGGETASFFYGKAQLVRTERAAAAVQVAHTRFDDGEDGLTVATAVVTTCIDDNCDARVSAHLDALTDDGSETLVFGGGSIVAGNRLKFVLDVGLMAVDDESILGAYTGFRVGNDKVAFDLGVIGGVDGDGEGAVIPLPMVGLSIRP